MHEVSHTSWLAEVKRRPRDALGILQRDADSQGKFKRGRGRRIGDGGREAVEGVETIEQENGDKAAVASRTGVERIRERVILSQ